MKKLLIQSLIVSVTLSCGVSAGDISTKTSKKAQGPIILTHPLINFMDKVMGVEVYGLILQVRREVRKRLEGALTKSGNKKGMYLYEGQNHTVTSLAKIESQYEMEYYSKKNYLIENKVHYSEEEWNHEFEQIEKEYAGRTKALRHVLEQAKDDFLKISEGYVEGARGTKEQTLILIKESCDKRGVENCFLLRWGEAEEGNETALLKNDVITFKEYAKFLNDLANFLEDMARSCPRSWKKFMDFVRKNRTKHGTA